jgi:hypothetical protein
MESVITRKERARVDVHPLSVLNDEEPATMLGNSGVTTFLERATNGLLLVLQVVGLLSTTIITVVLGWLL